MASRCQLSLPPLALPFNLTPFVKKPAIVLLFAAIYFARIIVPLGHAASRGHTRELLFRQRVLHPDKGGLASV